MLCSFDAILIFDEINNVFKDIDVSNINNEYNYSNEFKNELKEFCNADYFIYDKFKNVKIDNLNYIFDYFSIK